MGSARLYLRPLIEGVTWMEDYGVYTEVTTLICTSRSPHDDVARYAATTGNVSGITIISSEIEEYDPVYTASNRTGTNASIMLVNSSLNQWAQLGWIKHSINGPVAREVFVEFFMSPTDNRFQFWPGEPIGQMTWYQIQYTAPQTFEFFVQGGWRRTDIGQFTPAQYQVFGETHDWVDQMPGGVNNHVVFSGAQYYANGWSTITSSASASAPYAMTTPFGGRYEIWDTACAN